MRSYSNDNLKQSTPFVCVCTIHAHRFFLVSISICMILVLIRQISIFTWNFYFGIIFPSGSFLFCLCYAYLVQCLHYIFLMTYLIVAVYLAGCWSDCIGAVGYTVTGRFHIIVSISISCGACQWFPTIAESLSIPKSLLVVTNSKCRRHRTSTEQK